MEYRVVAPDPAWRGEAEREAARIRAALGGIALAIHHIGSTSIPGISAKPVIDLCLEVSGLGDLDAQTASLEALGYEALGEYGIARRRFFLRDDASGVRTHHVHAFATGDTEIARHLAFRDYLRAHPVVAEAYGRLKEELAGRHPGDLEAYMEGKDPFIKEHEAKALEWSAEGRGAK